MHMSNLFERCFHKFGIIGAIAFQLKSCYMRQVDFFFRLSFSSFNFTYEYCSENFATQNCCVWSLHREARHRVKIQCTIKLLCPECVVGDRSVTQSSRLNHFFFSLALVSITCEEKRSTHTYKYL